MKNFLIAGCIIDDDSQRFTHEDVTPAQIGSFIKGLGEGEELTLDITSPGGSCTAGLAISNMIRQCSANGHRTKAHVIGLAASMASVIACSCDELEMDSTAFIMVHNPWSSVQGDADELRKEAKTLDQFKAALVSIYRSKFDVDSEGMNRLMDEETWITGAESKDYSLRCSVIEAEPLRAMAFLQDSRIPRFNKTPKGIMELVKMSQAP